MTQNYLEIAADLIAEAKQKGEALIQSGAWIDTQENMIANQKTLDDDDEAKDFDYTVAPYWIITDDGQVGPMQDAQDLADFLEDIE